jgi:hypothetical protein
MGAIISGYWGEAESAVSKLTPAQISATSDTPIFSAVPAKESGITWVHDSAMSRAHYLPESMTGGCAF